MARGLRTWTSKPPVGVRINPSHHLAQGLIGAWNFAEGGGFTYYDAAQYGNGTYGNLAPATWVPAKSGIGLNFVNSLGQIIEVPHNSRFPITTNFSINVRFLMSLLKQSNGICGKSDGGSVAKPFAMRVNLSGVLSAILGNGITEQGVGVTGLVSGAWYDVCFTCDGTTLRLYLNGVLVDSQPVTISVTADGGGSLFIAAHNVLTFGLDGKMEFFRLWNRALTGPEAMNLYRSPYSFMQQPTNLFPNARYFWPPVTATSKGTLRSTIYAYKAPTSKIVVS